MPEASQVYKSMNNGIICDPAGVEQNNRNDFFINIRTRWVLKTEIKK